MNNDLRLHGLIGGSGINIKSIQRGISVIDVGVLTLSVPISTVDLSKSIVKITYNAGGPANLMCFKAEITTSTNLQITREASAGNSQVFWEIIEYDKLKSLQHGTASITTLGATNIPITSVDLSKATLCLSFSNTSTDATGSGCTARYRLKDSTTIEFVTGTTTMSVAWYVVEFN